MTATVPSLIDEHVSNGGTMEEACQALAQSYEGNQQMINLLITWIDTYADGLKAYESALENVFVEKDHSIVQSLDRSFAGEEESQSILTEVASSTRWCSVVERMAGKYKGTLFSNAFMREIRLLEAGISHAHVRTPERFLALITDTFSQLFNGQERSEEDLEMCYQRVATLSTYDESTTTMAIGLFAHLSRCAEDVLMAGVYKRMQQVIEAEAIKVIEAGRTFSAYQARANVLRLAIQMECTTLSICVDKRLLDALFTILSPGNPNRKFAPEIKVLNGTFTKLLGAQQAKGVVGDDTLSPILSSHARPNIQKAMLITILCEVHVLEDLIRALFTNSHRAEFEGRVANLPRRKCISLLVAYASLFMQTSAEDIGSKLSNEGEVEELRKELARRFRRIDLVAATCEDLYPGCPLFMVRKQGLEMFLESIEDEILARGICIWAREQVKGDGKSRPLLKSTPIHLGLLETIVEEHDTLRGEVIDALWEAFIRDHAELEITETESLRDEYMKCITGMIRIGMGSEVVKVVTERWAQDQRVDMSHLRTFVVGLLQAIEGPFSMDFASSVIGLLNHKRVQAAIGKDEVALGLVKEFRKEVE